MTRSASLARVLRDLKAQRDEILERKQAYDYDCNRAVMALTRFNDVVTRESAPDLRRSLSPHPPAAEDPTHSLDDDDDTEAVTARDGSPVPAWAKRVWRLIALQTHPDMIAQREDLDEWQCNMLVSLYRQAVVAWSEGDYPALAEIAAELDIETGMPTEELERSLEAKIASLREESQRLQRSVSWAWGTSFGDTPLRVQVLRRCCQLMSIPTPEESVLLEIIRELESQAEFDIIDRLGRVRRMRAGAERRRLGQRPERRIR